MSVKKTLVVVCLSVVALLVVAAVVGRLLVGVVPAGYQPKRLTEEELLRAEERLWSIQADLYTDAQVAEPFILELTLEQIKEMLAVVDQRYQVFPEYITAPDIMLDKGALWAYALVTWNGQQSVVSIRIKPFIDSAGLLHLELGELKAGALGLPESFLPDTLAKVEKSLSIELASSASDSDAVMVAEKNPDALTRVFTALHGAPVPADFVTREDLRMTIKDISISPERIEIEFQPLLQNTSSNGGS